MVAPSPKRRTPAAAGIVPGTHVESAFESGRSGEAAFESGPPSEPKYGRHRHVHSPQPTWAKSFACAALHNMCIELKRACRLG